MIPRHRGKAFDSNTNLLGIRRLSMDRQEQAPNGAAHFPQADFWPGTVSGLLVKRKCTARRASPRPANTLTSLDPVLKMNALATSVSHDRPNHLALSHHRAAGRRRDGRSIQSRG